MRGHKPNSSLLEIVKEAAKRFDARPLYRASIQARMELITSKRVAPAAGERQHVEQQAKEEDV